jgi:hypothetical protein
MRAIHTSKHWVHGSRSVLPCPCMHETPVTPRGLGPQQGASQPTHCLWLQLCTVQGLRSWNLLQQCIGTRVFSLLWHCVVFSLCGVPCWHAGCLHLQAGGGSWGGWSGSLVQAQVGLRVIHWGAAAVLVVSMGYLWVTWLPWAASQPKQPCMMSHRHQGMSSLLAYLLLFGCLCAPAPRQHAARLLSWNAFLQCVGRCTVLSVLCCACVDAATTNMKPLLASYVLTQRDSAMHGMAGTQATAGQPARAAALSPQVPVPYSVWHKALICARRCRR